MARASVARSPARMAAARSVILLVIVATQNIFKLIGESIVKKRKIKLHDRRRDVIVLEFWMVQRMR
jgi:hypothetical protein